MKKIEDVAAYFFITAVAILSIITIMGTWDVLGSDVIGKSYETLGLLAVVSVVVMVAGKYLEKTPNEATSVVEAPDPSFQGIRKATVTVLIVAVVFLTILGVMAIWDLISDRTVLYKALSSVGILAFSSFIIVMTALQREGNDYMKRNSGSSFGMIIFLLVMFALIRMFGFLW